MLVDYHIHLLGHNDRSATFANIDKFLAKAQEMDIKEIGFTDHNRYYQQLDFELLDKVAKNYPDLEVRHGIEMDYNPGEEEEIEEFLSQFKLDYIIGSIHYLDGWMFDHPDYKAQYDNWEIDKLYKKYYSHVAQAASSGLFDMIGHLDLIKIFKFKPADKVAEYAIPALDAVEENDLVIGVNTNGLNKPVGELYPTKDILEIAYEKGVKVTLGSDAHIATRVGENLAQVRELLLDIGYQKIATFNDRKRKMVQL